MKKHLFLFLIAGLLFSACTTGLGEEIDLEAPEITITSPVKLSFQKKNITFTGTCTDNKAVTSVIISYKLKRNEITPDDAQLDYDIPATIDGDTWSCEIKIPDWGEGELTFTCTANDAFGNSSTKSSRNITLFVDETAPIGLAWYVYRPTNDGSKNQTPLETMDFLKNLYEDSDFSKDLKEESVNKDYPQNEEFIVHGNFYDAMNIDTVTLNLYADDINSTEPILSKTLKSTEGTFFIGEGNSIYTPEFVFSKEDINNTILKTERHLLRVEYYSKDNDTEDNFNEDTRDTGLYILWDPASDNPGIGIQKKLFNEQNIVSARINSTLPIDFYDDDSLDCIYYALKKTRPTEEQITESYFINSDEEPADFEKNVNKRDEAGILTVPSTPGQMYLVIYAKDIRGNKKIKIIDAEITDLSKPLLFVSEPVENSIPVVNSNNIFQIKGYSLDTKGSKYIAVIYNPTEITSQEKAEELFNNNLDVLKNNLDAKITLADKKVIWYKEFEETNSAEEWKKQEFSFDLKLLEDFNKITDANQTVSTATDRKVFEMLLSDVDGNIVYKPFILNGDSTKPTIDIIYPNKELMVQDYAKDLEIQFKGQKTSNLGMNEDSYKVTTKIGKDIKEFYKNHGLTVENGIAKVKIPAADLTKWEEKNKQPTFTFYVTDLIGNEGEGQRSIILSSRPTVKSIVVDKKDGIYKAGESLNIKVNFSKQVKVTGEPELLIKYSNNDTEEHTAKYTGGSGSDTLIFEYEVPKDASSEGISCSGFKLDPDPTKVDTFPIGIQIQATELGEADIFTTIENADVLVNQHIKLDGVSPKITLISINDTDNTGSYTKGKQLTAEVKMSEEVLVNGSPKLNLSVGDKNLPFDFQTLKTIEQPNGNKYTTLLFVHTIKDGDPQGLIVYDSKNVFTEDDVKYISDKTGNGFISEDNASKGSTNISVDYTAPTTAPSHNLIKETYNTNQIIVLDNIEENATAYFSRDGGISWIKYNKEQSDDRKLGNGVHTIVTRQADKAGNMSAMSEPKKIEINVNFAPITGFSIDIGDGNYKEGREFTFTLDFDEAVKVTDKNDIKIKIISQKNVNMNQEITCEVPEETETTSVKFKYKITNRDFYDGVQVEQITFSDTFTDVFGNKPAKNTYTKTDLSVLKSEDGGNRSKLVLDGILPTVTGKTPDNGGISKTAKFSVTLTFSEKVYKEEGEIILQRKGNWAIPAVLTSEEFSSIYNKVTLAADKEKLMKTKAGNGVGEELMDETGQPVGPYRKITHGLKQSGNYMVPDLDTKYVLAFKYGLFEDLNATDETVSNIRNVLKSIDYDKHFMDVTSSGVKLIYNNDDTTTVTIEFSEEIENGLEWDLIIPEKAFRDNAENFYPGMNLQLVDSEKTETETYSVWSDKVATPVIRLDRYSHGFGAHEPNPTNKNNSTDKTKWTWGETYISVNDVANDGKGSTNTITQNSGRSIVPTGWARVRIDCATPDASITYKEYNSGSTDVSAATNTATASHNNGVDNFRGTITANADATKSNLEFTSGGTTYSGYIYVGDGNSLTARKDYVSATAAKTEFTSSSYGYEGIFKTIVYTSGNDNSVWNTGKNYINVEGGTAPGGEPNVSGFPLRDSAGGGYTKNAYVNTTAKSHTWVTYEIISTDFAILLRRNNSGKSYPICSYGQGINITVADWEDNG